MRFALFLGIVFLNFEAYASKCSEADFSNNVKAAKHIVKAKLLSVNRVVPDLTSDQKKLKSESGINVEKILSYRVGSFKLVESYSSRELTKEFKVRFLGEESSIDVKLIDGQNYILFLKGGSPLWGYIRCASQSFSQSMEKQIKREIGSKKFIKTKSN